MTSKRRLDSELSPKEIKKARLDTKKPSKNLTI